MAATNGVSRVGRTDPCHYCGWYRGGHDPHCPELVPRDSEARKRWKAGYDIGYVDRDGTRCPTDPVAILGYGRGQYVLEYNENVRREDYYPD